jgi:hypothetical protein
VTVLVSLPADLKKVMCEALRVKSKVEWRLQEVREVRKRQAMHV